MKDKLESLIVPLIVIYLGFSPFFMSINIQFLQISFLLPYAPLLASISIIYILKIIFENIKQITPKNKLILFSIVIALGLIFSCYLGYVIGLGNEFYILALIFALLNILLVKYNYSLDDDFSFITIGLLIIFTELLFWAFSNVSPYIYVINPSLMATGLFSVWFGIIFIRSYYEKTKVRLISGAILFSGVLLSYYILKPDFNDPYILLFNFIIPVGLFYGMWEISKEWNTNFNSKAISYLKKEKYEEALKLLENDMGKYDDCYITWYNQGYTLEKLEKYDDALISYEKALKIESNDLDTLYRKANVLINLERFEEAINCFDRYLELKPEEITILVEKGFALQYLHNHQEAIEYFDRFLKINPNELFIHVKKAESLNELKKSDEALEIIEEVIKRDPENYYAWFSKAYILKGLDKPEEALTSYEKALEIDPESEFCWALQGNILKELDKTEEALKSYEKALEIIPDDESFWSAKGQALEELERNDEALRSYEKALELNPEFEEAIDAKKDLESKMKS